MECTLEFEFLSLVCEYPNLLARNVLKEEYFEGKDKLIYKALVKQYELHKELIYEEIYKDIGGYLDYFAEIITGNAIFINKEIKFEELQKAIIDKYKLKKYKEITSNLKGNYEENFNELKNLMEIGYLENDFITSKDIIESLTRQKNKINLGFEEIDKNLNLSETDLLILAAGTGVGKTAFALNLLNNLSKKYQCVYVNLEMSKNILYKRLVAIKSGLELMKLNNIKTLCKEDIDKVKISLEEIEKSKIVLISGSANINSIKKAILNIKTNRPMILFIDHIGLIKSNGGSLYEKMTEIAKELRTMCLEMNCTIIGLCQLSRESQKENTRPKLQDLRDSGEIEQSARKVLMLYNKSKYDEKSRTQDLELIIAKNDDGNRIIKDFTFDKYNQKFYEK